MGVWGLRDRRLRAIIRLRVSHLSLGFSGYFGIGQFRKRGSSDSGFWGLVYIYIYIYI